MAFAIKKEMKMRNLVVGSEGFVGRPLCDYLEQQGEEVVRFDIKRGEHEDGRCVMYCAARFEKK
jgi:nucleoside-diphosphate-sugar epimerase